MKKLSIKEIREWFYEKDGWLYWKKSPNKSIRPGSKITNIRQGSGHIRVGFRHKRYYAHRILFALYNGYMPDNIIDHINRNPSDNRKHNLRISTYAGNILNQLKQKRKLKNTTSEYKGVNLQHGKWRAYIVFQGKQVFLGNYSNQEKAAKAYDKAALKYYGEFAVLNFPDKDVKP